MSSRRPHPAAVGFGPGGEVLDPAYRVTFGSQGVDGLSMSVEIPPWNEVGPRYGLEVVGPQPLEEV